jgi:hypothetical protein
VRISANLASWTSTGLITVGITGPLLFLWDWHRYLNNPAFLVKMVILSLALITHFALDRSKHRKLAAVLSLILWSCVVLAGRAIADFDIPLLSKGVNILDESSPSNQRSAIANRRSGISFCVQHYRYCEMQKDVPDRRSGLANR